MKKCFNEDEIYDSFVVNYSVDEEFTKSYQELLKSVDGEIFDKFQIFEEKFLFMLHKERAKLIHFVVDYIQNPKNKNKK